MRVFVPLLQMFLLPFFRGIYLLSGPTATFYSIAAPNKHPNCKNRWPAQPSLSLTYELHLSHRKSPQTKEQKEAEYKARCHFSFGGQKKLSLSDEQALCVCYVF